MQLQIIVFAIVPAMNNSNDLVEKVAAAIDLEKEGEDQNTDKLSIDDLVTFDFSEPLKVVLNGSSDNSVKYANFGITLSLNKKDSSYDKYKDELENNESLMIATISNIVRKYTKEELLRNQETILQEITLALREMYNETTFIYETSFVSLLTN